MSESVPTSVSSFAHRRARADSTTSFTYYQDEEDQGTSVSEDNEAIIDDESEVQYEQDDSSDLEAGELAIMRRTSSANSRNSVHDRLLRSDSARTEGSNFGYGGRTSQKLYIVTEDLTIVVAGFRTSNMGFAIYTTLCMVTFGLGYLLLRWLPRWQVRFIGTPSPLKDCTWVVIEVSAFSVFSFKRVKHSRYGNLETKCRLVICTSKPVNGESMGPRDSVSNNVFLAYSYYFEIDTV